MSERRDTGRRTRAGVAPALALALLCVTQGCALTLDFDDIEPCRDTEIVVDGECVCPIEGQQWVDGACACPQGASLNALGDACLCPPSATLDVDTFTCVCPAPLVAVTDGESSACACPTFFDASFFDTGSGPFRVPGEVALSCTGRLDFLGAIGNPARTVFDVAAYARSDGRVVVTLLEATLSQLVLTTYEIDGEGAITPQGSEVSIPVGAEVGIPDAESFLQSFAGMELVELGGAIIPLIVETNGRILWADLESSTFKQVRIEALDGAADRQWDYSPAFGIPRLGIFPTVTASWQDGARTRAILLLNALFYPNEFEPCSGDLDCPGDLTCDGRCTRACSEAAPCPETYRCEDSACVLDSDTIMVAGDLARFDDAGETGLRMRYRTSTLDPERGLQLFLDAEGVDAVSLIRLDSVLEDPTVFIAPGFVRHEYLDLTSPGCESGCRRTDRVDPTLYEIELDSTQLRLVTRRATRDDALYTAQLDAFRAEAESQLPGLSSVSTLGFANVSSAASGKDVLTIALPVLSGCFALADGQQLPVACDPTQDPAHASQTIRLFPATRAYAGVWERTLSAFEQIDSEALEVFALDAAPLDPRVLGLLRSEGLVLTIGPTAGLDDEDWALRLVEAAAEGDDVLFTLPYEPPAGSQQLRVQSDIVFLPTFDQGVQVLRIGAAP